MSHFNAFKRGVRNCLHKTELHRTDFYKISLVIGDGLFYYNDLSVEISGAALIFHNPSTPHIYKPTSEKQAGYFCLFNDKFIEPSLFHSNIRKSPLIDLSKQPVYLLNPSQTDYLLFIFQKMLEEMDNQYEHKYDVILHYLHLIIHEADKMNGEEELSKKNMNASLSITTKFMEILERQFPIDSSEQSINLKKPSDFAEQLSIHVNHLNRAINETTGKSTSEIISLRVATEAKALLKHTHNSIAEIAYTLGFEHPSNFNLFFKKHTSTTPKRYRNFG